MTWQSGGNRWQIELIMSSRSHFIISRTFYNVCWHKTRWWWGGWGDTGGWQQPCSSFSSQMLSEAWGRLDLPQHAEQREGSAVVATLSGIITVDVSQTPHGPVLTPVLTHDPLNRVYSHTHRNTFVKRGWNGGKYTRGGKMEQEERGDEADHVGELSAFVCEWDWLMGITVLCPCDSAHKWRMRGCYVGKFSPAQLPDQFHVFQVQLWAPQIIALIMKHSKEAIQ